MAYLNARGANFPIDAMTTSDVSYSAQIKSNGSALAITDATISLVVKDAEKNGTTVGTYAQTVTDESAGEWSLKIPKAAFASKEDQDLSYEVTMTISGEDTPLLHGVINILESA